MSHQAELVSHEHIPGSYFSVLSPQTCLGFTRGCRDGCVCARTCLCAALVCTGTGQALVCTGTAACFASSPPTAPTSLSAKLRGEENTEPGLLTRETALLFLSSSPCSRQSLLGFGQVLHLNPCKMKPFCLVAGREWPVGCLCLVLRIPHRILAVGGEDCHAHRELSPSESQFWALPCLDGQVCSAPPVPPHPRPGFGVFV